MANVGVTFDFAAESAKLRSEIDKVRKELGTLNATAKGIGDGFKAMGVVLAGAFSLAAIGGFLKSVNATADALNDLSGRMGASASGLQSLQVAATLAGGSAGGLNTALAKMSTTLGDALSGNKQAAAAFDRLGLSAKELSSLKADEAFKAIADATASIPNTFERASVAQDIFGKGAKDIAGLLAEGGAAIDDVNQKLAEQGAAIDDLDIARIGVMNDDLQFQQTVVTNLGTKFLAGLSPAIGVTTDAVSNMLSNIGGATEAGRGFGVVMTGAIKLVEAAVYSLLAVFESIRFVVATTLEAIVGGVSKVTGALSVAAGVVGLDGLSQGLRNASEGAAGFAASFGDVANSARANAQAAAAAAIKAGTEMLQAGVIFDQQAAALEARAQSAVNRVTGAQGAPGGAGGVGAGTTAADPMAGVYQSIDKRGGEGLISGDLMKDVTQDSKYLYQQSLNTALLDLASEQSATELSIAQVGQQSLLDSFLLNNEYMVAAEQAKNATLGSSLTQLAGMAMQQGGILGKFGKAYAIAQTIWSTGTAIMNAMAQVPYPANIAVAALIAVKGAAQLASIKKTNIGSGGSVAGAGGGGSAAVTRSTPDGTQRASTESKERSSVQIVVQGNLIETGSTARWLQEVFKDAVDNRDMVFFSANSRQAMELAG